MSGKLVAFILGAGGNVGAGLAKAWSAKGYTVAVGSRSGSTLEGATLAVKLDLTQPATIKSAFAEVTKSAGPPNVVVLNGALRWLSHM